MNLTAMGKVSMFIYFIRMFFLLDIEVEPFLDSLKSFGFWQWTDVSLLEVTVCRADIFLWLCLGLGIICESFLRYSM